MFKHCPQCGSNLEKEYKFCPECGTELKKVENEKVEAESPAVSLPSKEDSQNKIVCDNCGEENDADNDVCSGCGVKLQQSSGRKSSSSTETKTADTPKPHKKAASHQKNKKNTGKQHTAAPASSAHKKLDKIKTITVLAVGLGIALIILIFSGALNSLLLPGTSENTVSNTGNQNSGVDLSNVQKINDLETQIKSNPKDTVSILELAHLKNDAGMFEQAITNYKQYLALVPSDPDARIDMGICYYNLRNYNTAIDEMQKALKFDPKHQIGYLDLGIVNLAAGNFDKSKEWLQKAVDLDPNSEYGKKAEELLKSHSNQTNGGQ